MHMVRQKNRINLASYMKITNKNGQNGGGGNFNKQNAFLHRAHHSAHHLHKMRNSAEI